MSVIRPVVSATADAVAVNLGDRGLGELPEIQDGLTNRSGCGFHGCPVGLEALDEIRIVDWALSPIACPEQKPLPLAFRIRTLMS